MRPLLGSRGTHEETTTSTTSTADPKLKRSNTIPPCSHSTMGGILLVGKATEGVEIVITVYSKPDCQQCRMTYLALDAKGLDYQVVDVTESANALEFVKELGYLAAPVIVVSEHDHWTGFRPDNIARVAAGGATESEAVEA